MTTFSHPSFIQNKYFQLYINIVNKARTNSYSCYTEKHHIIPRSLGGSNAKTNLVKVSAREHFILHFLLTKFTKGEHWYAMVKAFNLMGASANEQSRYMNSRLYDSNRKHMSETMSLLQANTKNSQFGTKWFTNTILHIEVKIKDHSNVNEFIEQGWVRGRLISRKPKQITIKKPRVRVPSVKKHRPPHIGRLIRVHRVGRLICVNLHFFYTDYAIDGWRILTKQSKDGVKVKSKTTIENLTLPKQLAEEFVQSGLWEYGFHNPNHKGTSGKTYKWIDGKKVFD